MIHEDGPVTDAIFEERAAKAEIVIGQIDLPESRLKRASSLRAVFNVEGNFPPNIDYTYCFRHAIRVLNISPVFAEPVAEAALGMAIDLCRGITRSDCHFRQSTEQYGLAANKEAFSLFHQEVGLIGFGDLGRAILPLLRPLVATFARMIRGYRKNMFKASDVKPLPWMRSCAIRALFSWLQGRHRKIMGFLGTKQFSSMQRGAALILVSRASVVDFDAMLDFAAKGHIRFATDVFPEEPLPSSHRARHTDNTILCSHQAGAMETAIKGIGKMVVADAELIARGLPPILCKSANLRQLNFFAVSPSAKLD